MSNDLHEENLKKTGRWGKKAAGAIIFDPYDNKFIISKRSEEVLEPLTYGTIGGAIDPKEDTITALNRELEEELQAPTTYKFQKLSTFKESNFKYDNYVAIAEKPFNINECTLDWENESLEKRSLKDWVEEDNLHFGLKALFKDKKAMSILKEWENFSLEDSMKKLEKIKKVIGRLNKEIPKNQEEDRSDVLDFLSRAKSNKFKELNKLRAKVNKFKNK
jgi:8-oxo-dGTP pyrophosphatase MutT (NUDIX family)